MKRKRPPCEDQNWNHVAVEPDGLDDDDDMQENPRRGMAMQIKLDFQAHLTSLILSCCQGSNTRVHLLTAPGAFAHSLTYEGDNPPVTIPRFLRHRGAHIDGPDRGGGYIFPSCCFLNVRPELVGLRRFS